MLGYTEVSWDNWSRSEPQPASTGKAWAGLTEAEKTAALHLGFTHEMWDNQSPPSVHMKWSALTETERLAATVLCYTEASWNNLSGDEVQPPSSKKGWDEMDAQELGALVALGFSKATWTYYLAHPFSSQPESFSKEWSQLSSCVEPATAGAHLTLATSKAVHATTAASM